MEETIIELHNCTIIDGQVIDSENNRVPIELYRHFTLTMEPELQTSKSRKR